jgi:hypothetical protein
VHRAPMQEKIGHHTARYVQLAENAATLARPTL